MRLASLSTFALLLFVACGGDAENNDGDAAPNADAAPGSDGSGGPDAAPPVARLMYVTTGTAQTLAVVRLEADGTMTALPAMDVDVATNTGALAYARTTQRLYLGAGSNVHTLALDSDGAPTDIGTTGTPGNPTFIGVANNETILATAYFGGNSIASHNVEGNPEHLEVEVLTTGAIQPHAAMPGPNGLIYVPHRDGGTTHWYSVAADGGLTFVGELVSALGVGPRHIAFTPDEQFAYVVNEQGDSVTAHSVAADGTLTALDTITTLAVPDPGNDNACADIHVTPDGKFVYASNRDISNAGGNDSIAMYSIGADGNLTSLGIIATEPIPREFEIDPAGNYVVVAGQGSGFLQSYAIGSDGVLTPITTGTGTGRLMVGGSPRWAIID